MTTTPSSIDLGCAGRAEGVDWKSLLMRFLKMYGEMEGDWYAEHWEEFGITKEEAHKLFDEYAKLYPDD